MNCRKFALVAHAYLTDALSHGEVADVDKHLQECAECSEFKRLCTELTCKELVEFLSDYLEESLEPTQRVVFDRHLSLCSDCRNYVDSFRRAMSCSALAIGAHEVTKEVRVPEELIRAILAARDRERESG
jgi:predicted anti-sigma-YlaC factor YlaD